MDALAQTQKLIIDAVETVIVDLPLVRLQRFSAIGTSTQSVVLITVRTRDGAVGVGESVTPSGPWWGGESVETIKVMIDEHLAPLVTGQDAFNLTAIMDRMDRKVFGNPFAKAGIEMALWDVIGKVLQQPVYNLIGGKVRESLPVSWPLATGDAKAEIAEAEEKLAARIHRIFKLKMGALPPEQDVARAIEVARALRDHASVRADPNESWDEPTARWAIPRMVEAGIEMIEQPMPRWNIDAAARITAATPVPIMADEGVCSVRDMMEIARRNGASLVSLKLMKSAGIRTSRLIADVAKAAGIPVYMGTFLETSYGTGANMQLCATLPDLPYGGELAGPLLIAEDICQVPAQYRDFELHLQPGNGLGVQLDKDKIRAFRRDRNYSVHAANR